MMMDINSNKPLLYWEEMFPREFLLTDDSIKAEYDSRLTREYFHQKYFRKFAVLDFYNQLRINFADMFFLHLNIIMLTLQKFLSEDTTTLKSEFLQENSDFQVSNMNEVFQTIVDASFDM